MTPDPFPSERDAGEAPRRTPHTEAEHRQRSTGQPGPVPDFPSELVEAAACAITTSGRRGSTDQEAQAYDAAYAVLAAVLPLIEQRVIDRLAGEAGENPYRDLSMPLLSEACKIEAEVWDAGAACGVAAERARMLSPESLKVAAKALCHQWRKGESYEDRARAAIAAALAPERTGEGNDA